jgi:hypothetical protein
LGYRLGSLPAADFGAVRGGGDHQRRQAPIYPDPTTMLASWAHGVVVLLVQVRSVEVEADIPAAAMTADRGEQDLGAWRRSRVPDIGVGLCDRAQ